MCGTLRISDVGREVVLNGWVSKKRNLGGLIFCDLRDRSGIAQIVFTDEVEKAVFEAADSLKSEYVIGVKGKVIEKDAYKYLKIEVKGKDSGGEYNLTQYITVKGGKSVVLSFYTSGGKDTSYTEDIFNSQFSNIGATKTWLTVALAFVLGLCVVLCVMIVRDLKPPKREEAIEEQLN